MFVDDALDVFLGQIALPHKITAFFLEPVQIIVERAVSFCDRLARVAGRLALVACAGECDVFGLALGNAASGSVVTEIVFSVPGMGRLLIEGVQHRDYPMIQAIIVVFGVMVLLANLFTDLTYAWLNPRIRYA